MDVLCLNTNARVCVYTVYIHIHFNMENVDAHHKDTPIAIRFRIRDIPGHINPASWRVICVGCIMPGNHHHHGHHTQTRNGPVLTFVSGTERARPFVATDAKLPNVSGTASQPVAVMRDKPCRLEQRET